MEDRSLPAGLAENPGADWHDEARLLGEWDELQRRDDSALRMVPAQKCLDTVIRALPVEPHDGLVVDLELL